MAGEMKYTAANTTASQSADPRLAKAFCEGREAQVAGNSTNPFPAGSEQNDAWQAGHDTTTPEGLVDNCALAIPITVPDLTGMTSANAQEAITAAGLAVGKITGTTGVVTVQVPTAATKVQPHSSVAFTIA